jgi:diguanylate cyclase (GGDEF)-like protein/PAS domain S-box-containing protein
VPRRTPARPVGPSDRFVAVTDQLLAPVVLLSRTGEIQYVNTAAAAALHQERSLLVGRSFSELTHPADRARLVGMLRSVSAGRPTGRNVRLRVRARDSFEWRVLDCTADNILADEDVRGILLSMYDVTESQAENLALAVMAFQDPLTGLPNRAKVVAELQRLLSLDGDVVVGLIGMDRLSVAEDSLGRTGADRYIEAVGQRIRAGLPEDVVVGRLEGGTFATVLPAELASVASALAWRVVERARGPMFVGSQELNASVSIGLATRDANATVESLLWDAGLALHRAEAQGGGRVEAFSNGHRREVIARLELEADLRRAIADGAMSVAFQPIVRLADRTATGAEALLRWHHPRGDLQPLDFIPVAEETGLIVPLGEWVTGEAARLAHFVGGGRVSVNLSPRQLATPALPRILDGIVTARAERGSVQFEITEDLLIEEWEHTTGVLAELRRLGYRVGLDDFGTGYSSLGYLRRLPLDFLKIDRSLVADVDRDRQARAVAGAIIAMADALDLDVIAEGVERESQAEVLQELGADDAQGFLFGAAEELFDRADD